MLSFLSNAFLPFSKPQPKPIKQPVNPASRPSTLSPAPNTTTKLAPPPFSKPPFCCSSHQVPRYTSTSQTLTIFLRALIIRRQQLYANSSSASSTTSSSFSPPQHEPLFPFLLTPSYPLSISSLHSVKIIELETITNFKSYERYFKHQYFIPVPGREMRDIEADLIDGFREVSFSWAEERKREVDGEWEFVTRDQVAEDKVWWECEGCGWGYWARLKVLGV